jgi:hypothetical protein
MRSFVSVSLTALVAAALGGCEGSGSLFSSCPALPEPNSAAEVAAVQKPLEEVVGSVWTENLDCRYLDPPKEVTLITQAFDCETATHNLEVLRGECPYFVSQSTLEDGPIWCLQSAPRGNTAIAREYRNIYCR